MKKERLPDAERQRILAQAIETGRAEAREGLYSSRSVRDIARAVLDETASKPPLPPKA